MDTKKLKGLLFLSFFVGAGIFGGTKVFAAQLASINMVFGDRFSIFCNGGRVTTSKPVIGQLNVWCYPPTSTTPSPVPALVARLVLDPGDQALEGKTLSGKVAIQAQLVGTATVSRVNFTLKNSSGVLMDSHTELLSPYYFKGDHLGAPYYWDTTGLKGGYLLTAEMIMSDGKVVVTSASFVIGSATTTPVPPGGPVTTPVPPVVGGSNVFCNDPSLNTWHAPGSHPCSYLKTGHPHEHGDAPPAWVTAVSGVTFMGMHNTSPVEDTVKHASMKGYAATMNGMDMYLVYHFTSTPMERFGAYHSYQFWMRPAGDNNPAHVSHMQGWTYTGVPIGTDTRGVSALTSRYERTKGDPGVRPVILVVDQASLDAGIGCEQWYNATADWSIDFGITICGTATIYNRANEQSGSATVDSNGNYLLTGVFDKSTWKPTGDMGLSRRLELAWYGPNSTAAPNRGNPPKDVTFYATQFGERVGGPSDARCSGTSQGFDGVTYKNVCMPQYISSSARAIEFPGNAIQKTFPGQGIVQLPN